jgi:hypothetical protein
MGSMSVGWCLSKRMCNSMIDFLLDKLGITPALIAGASLWALALYLIFWQLNNRLVDLCGVWLNEMDRSMYSKETLERRPAGWEERNLLFASVLSVIPALVASVFVFVLLSGTLGQSWALATGILISIGAGVYQLGRQDARNSGTNRRP